MDVSDGELAILKGAEGCRLDAYRDQRGVWTIGWGTTRFDMRPVQEGDVCTVEMAEAWFRRDVRVAVVAVNTCIAVQLNQNQFDALVSFTYNLGSGALRVSTMRKLINAGDFAGAAAEFPKWDHAGAQVSAGLLTRRQHERALFETPVAEEQAAA